MTAEILQTIAVAALALALFAWNRLRVDVVGLIVMCTLIVTGLVSVREGVSGFANEAMLTVAAMFILSAGLVRTGAIDDLGRIVGRLAGKSELRLLAVSIALVVPLSAFVNNTPVVAVMVPMVMGLSRGTSARPSRLLMPISFASQLGGTLTLIGTSTNLLVAGLVLELGMPRIGLFDITPPALIMAAAGIVYLLTVGRWLTPVRDSAKGVMAAYELREYLSVLLVEPDSPLAGKSLGESRFATRYGLEVVAIDRQGRRIVAPGAHSVVHAGDALIVRGHVGDLARTSEVEHLRIATPTADPPLPELEEKREQGGDIQLAELMVPPRSPLVGRLLGTLGFRARYGVPVMGVQRHGTSLTERMREVTLAAGDLLLVRGTAEDLRRIHEGRDLALLGPLALPARRARKMPVAIAILAAVVGLAALNVMPVLVAALLGVLAMFLTGCVRPDEAYREMDWTVVVLLGAIIPLGIAMRNSGAAEYLSLHLLRLAPSLGVLGVLAAFYLTTSLLTEVISNNAAAVVLTPIAIASAESLGVSPMPLVVTVMFAASNSFMTPIGYQTNTFVFGPGGYRFGDFARVGGPLNLLMVIVATLAIPLFFPF
jgi:di/tricarboxylate transporter